MAMAKAAIVVCMEVDEEDWDGEGTNPVTRALAEMLDAVREVLGNDRKNVAVWAAIKEKADEVEALFEDTP